MLKKIDDEVKAIVQDSADFAQSSPEPDPSELWTDILLATPGLAGASVETK